MSEWQPIATAPKDGAAILVWSGKVNIVCWAKYEGGPGVSSSAKQPRNWNVCQDEKGLLDEGWDTGAGWFMEPGSAPTHWMPLPASPI